MVSISVRYSCSRRRSSGVMGLPSTVYRLIRFLRHRPQSSSASRLTAGAAGFLNLSQSGDRPER